ncbi:MAG: FAD-dependent oxidoreductase [Roseiarcus sp.]|uniref:FAD-dependent oxidoreductase n=1 Tax=Roseiarcus sp. TaxID=1969460 RepID=UPI003BB054FF
MTIKAPPSAFETVAQVVVVGAGAAGLCAALAASEAGAEVVVLERDIVPRGSTALSAGLIPAAGTRFQRALELSDSPDLFSRDIQAKAHGEADKALVRLVAREAGPTVEWLADRYGLPFSVVDDFDYPGHSARRMHGLPSRSGLELVDRLRAAVEQTPATLLTQATVAALFVNDDRRVLGAEVVRPDGAREAIGCNALVLACNGYGGNPDLVARHIPAMKDALYFGHPGNRGDAVIWGRELGAKLAHLSGYQGHGSVAHPHGALITWATIMEGGFQVDSTGARFCDESRGYSEQAEDVIARPGGLAWTIFDLRIADIARQFEDFRQAEAAGAIIEAETIEALAARFSLPAGTLASTFAEVEALKRVGGADRFGRAFAGRPALAATLCGVKVTGALFHTQGGLVVDDEARVVWEDGGKAENLYAAGGAAAGVSGSKASGYLSGNGLLTATTLGRSAGRATART